MKFKFLLASLAVAIGCVSVGCSDDNDDISASKVPQAVRDTMSKMFPDVRTASWEQVPPYYVSDFTNSGFDTEAWFSADGSWAMTETDYKANTSYLPAAVQEAFAKSQYSKWVVDDVDSYRRTYDAFCVIEVERANTPDVSLFYSEEGVLLNEVQEFDITITPSTNISALR